MTDEFKVIGDQVHFGPWVVATLKEGLPATVRDKVVEALHEYGSWKYPDDYDPERYV